MTQSSRCKLQVPRNLKSRLVVLPTLVAWSVRTQTMLCGDKVTSEAPLLKVNTVQYYVLVGQPGLL